MQNTWLDQAFRLPGNPESAIDHNTVRVMKKKLNTVNDNEIDRPRVTPDLIIFEVLSLTN